MMPLPGGESEESECDASEYSCSREFDVCLFLLDEMMELNFLPPDDGSESCLLGRELSESCLFFRGGGGELLLESCLLCLCGMSGGRAMSFFPSSESEESESLLILPEGRGGEGFLMCGE